MAWLPALQVDRILDAAFHSFSFNSFALHEATAGHPLSVLAFFLLHKSGLISAFGMHPIKLARFLRKIEAGYPLSNPYHNSIHAADVLQVSSNSGTRLWPGELVECIAFLLTQTKTRKCVVLAPGHHSLEHVVFQSSSLQVEWEDPSLLQVGRVAGI